jgi:DNA-binding response OmpR family regulator
MNNLIRCALLHQLRGKSCSSQILIVEDEVKLAQFIELELQTGSKIPIIILTAKDETSDRVEGLDAGADDYVVKPFSVEELLARIRVHLRRTQNEETDLLQFNDLKLNTGTREVYRGDRAIELTAKEFELLHYLLSHARQVLTRDQILEQVWGYDFIGDSNIIEVYIRYLRLKLEAEGESRLIQTMRGVGYVLRE